MKLALAAIVVFAAAGSAPAQSAYPLPPLHAQEPPPQPVPPPRIELDSPGVAAPPPIVVGPAARVSGGAPVINVPDQILEAKLDVPSSAIALTRDGAKLKLPQKTVTAENCEHAGELELTFAQITVRDELAKAIARQPAVELHVINYASVMSKSATGVEARFCQLTVSAVNSAAR